MDCYVSNYSQLKIFRRVAYSHKSVGKLEPRTHKCVFLSYPDRVKGYRLCSKETKGFKIITSRDVLFIIKNAWFGEY